MRVGFIMPCRAVYRTDIEVPDELADKWFENADNKDIQTEILSYIAEKANEASISELNFIEDLPDEIDGEIEIYDETGHTNKSKSFWIGYTPRKDS